MGSCPQQHTGQVLGAWPWLCVGGGLVNHPGCGSWGGEARSGHAIPSQNCIETICRLKSCLPCFQISVG